jgi:hypothetical protein
MLRVMFEVKPEAMLEGERPAEVPRRLVLDV